MDEYTRLAMWFVSILHRKMKSLQENRPEQSIRCGCQIHIR